MRGKGERFSVVYLGTASGRTRGGDDTAHLVDLAAQATGIDELGQVTVRTSGREEEQQEEKSEEKKWLIGGARVKEGT